MATEALIAAECQMHNSELSNGGTYWGSAQDCRTSEAGDLLQSPADLTSYDASSKAKGSGRADPSGVVFTDKDINDIVNIPLDKHAVDTKSPESREILDLMDRVLNTPTGNNRLSQGSRTSTGSSSSIEFSNTSGPRSSMDIYRKVASPEVVSPVLTSSADRASMTRPQMVAKEILVTEQSYVKDIQEVIEGYLYHMHHHGMTVMDIDTIFGNIEDIFNFNKGLLDELEMCQTDPVRTAQCFVDKGQGFNSLYVQYCTNYPEASAFLSEVLKNKEFSDFFQERKQNIGHALPLETYLLKPVQRILKYHLLLEDIAKHYKQNDEGEKVIQAAVLVMTDVADYINEMKRLQEDAIRAQEILSRITDLEDFDVFSTGKLVLENAFRVHGSRGERYLFLFAKKLLICKKLEEEQYKLLDWIDCSNMMLVESLPKDPLLSFQVIRFDNQKINFTIQAKNPEIKREWTQQLKRLILENHPALIPTTARQAILGTNNNELNRSKYDSMQFEELDDAVLGTKIHLRRQRSQSGKENRGSHLAGIKRESVKSDDGFQVPRKATMNGKAKEFLDKKGKHYSSANDKNRPWRFRKQKPQKVSLEKMFDALHPQQVNRTQEEPAGSPSSPSKLVKSRSLESLRDMFEPGQEERTPQENQPQGNDDNPDAASQQLRRLSMLHDIISLDAKDEGTIKTGDSLHESNALSITDDSFEYPSADSVMRRAQDYEKRHLRQLTKSLIFDGLRQDDEEGMSPRTRPTSMPPVDDDLSPKRHYTFDETKRMFGVADTRISRGSTDLRKFGLSDFDIKRRLDSETSDLSVFERRSSHDTESYMSACERSDDSVGIDSGDESLHEQKRKLEKRLSIISDDDTSSTSIKNTIRRVSQAFSSHCVEKQKDSCGQNSGSMNDITTELSAVLGSEAPPGSPSVKDRLKRLSVGSFAGSNSRLEIPDRPRAKSSAARETGNIEPNVESASVRTGSVEVLVDQLNPGSSSFQSTEELYRTLDESCKALDEIQQSLDNIQEMTVEKTSEQAESENLEEKLLPSHLKSASVVSVTMAPKHAKSVYERAREYAALMQENTEGKREKTNVSRALYRRARTFDSGLSRDQEDGDVESSVKSPIEIRLERAASEDRVETRKKVFSYNSKDFLNEPEILNYYHGRVVVKSVADRIVEYKKLTEDTKYHTLPPRPKISVDEMLESLESIPDPNSKIYMDQRRKYSSLRTRSATPDKSLEFENSLNSLRRSKSPAPRVVRSALEFDQSQPSSRSMSPNPLEQEAPISQTTCSSAPGTSAKKITVLKPLSGRDNTARGESLEATKNKEKSKSQSSLRSLTPPENDVITTRNVIKFTTNVKMSPRRSSADNEETIRRDAPRKFSAPSKEGDDTETPNVQFSINFQVGDQSKKQPRVSTTFSSQMLKDSLSSDHQTVMKRSSSQPTSSGLRSSDASPVTRRKVTSFTSLASPKSTRRFDRGNTPSGTTTSSFEINGIPISTGSTGNINQESAKESSSITMNLLQAPLSMEKRSPSLRNIEKFIVKRRVEGYLKGASDHKEISDVGEEEEKVAEKREAKSAVERKLARNNERKLKARSLVEDHFTVDDFNGEEMSVLSNSKLQRSTSCEQVQQGTVRQLIGVFNA